MSGARVGVLAAAALAALAAAAPTEEGWRTFRGSWSATGDRHALATEGGRGAAIVDLSGSVVLTSGEGPGRGFRFEAIGYDDGRSLAIGRAVWTDERGDRIYSELRGEPVETGRRVVGRFTGGTGRHAGLTGDYAFTWQYVVEAGEGTVQGRSNDLEGRFRPGAVPR